MSPFEYLNQVCGVEEIVLPAPSGEALVETEVSASVVAETSLPAKIVFVSEVSRSEYHSLYQRMFEKMVAAMGLDLLQVQLVLSDDEPWPASQTKVRIELGGKEASFGWKDKSNHHLVVPSFTEMSKDPEFKKIAWQYLKDLKTLINS